MTSGSALSYAVARLAREAVQEERWESFVERSAVIVAEATHAGCVVALPGATDDLLHPVGLHHPDHRHWPFLEEIAGQPFHPLGFLGIAFKGERVHVDDVQPDDPRARLSPLGPIIERFSTTDLIAMPLDGRVARLGVLALISFNGPRLGGDVVEFADVAAALVAAFVERALLIDALEHATGRRQVRIGFDTTERHPGSERRAQSEDAVTQREREVLDLIARGYTNREIGERLVLSVRTVEWHRARIQWKLGANSRAELVEAASRLGLGP